MKKLVRKPSFNDLADKAAANCWRSQIAPWSSKWAKASDKKVLARIRARNQNLDGHGHGYAEPTFRCPTDCKSGFYKVMDLLSRHDIYGLTAKEIVQKTGAKSMSLTLRRLEGAKLIDRTEHAGFAPISWRLSGFGWQFLSAIKQEFFI